MVDRVDSRWLDAVIGERTRRVERCFSRRDHTGVRAAQPLSSSIRDRTHRLLHGAVLHGDRCHTREIACPLELTTLQIPIASVLLRDERSRDEDGLDASASAVILDLVAGEWAIGAIVDCPRPCVLVVDRNVDLNRDPAIGRIDRCDETIKRHHELVEPPVVIAVRSSASRPDHHACRRGFNKQMRRAQHRLVGPFITQDVRHYLVGTALICCPDRSHSGQWDRAIQIGMKNAHMAVIDVAFDGLKEVCFAVPF